MVKKERDRSLSQLSSVLNTSLVCVSLKNPGRSRRKTRTKPPFRDKPDDLLELSTLDQNKRI